MQNVVYRKALPEEREKYLDFANMVFSTAHCPHNFKTLIPKAYGDGRESAHYHNLAVREDGCIRGLVAALPNRLKVGDTVLKTGFIGTVSVHPYARSEGHMKALMQMTVEDMVASGVDMGMLGGQRQRYEYFGFTQAGLQLSHHISKTNLRHVLGSEAGPAIVVRDVKEAGDEELVARCAQMNAGRPISAERSAEEFVIIAKTWDKSLKIIEKDGAFAGYVICEGASMTELQLTDWSLTPWVIKNLLDNSDDNNARIQTGALETELNRELAKVEEGVNIEHFEMVRIFNFPKVIGALLRLQADACGLADGKRSFVIDGKPMTIEVTGGVPTVTEEAGEDAMSLTAKEAQMLFLNLSGGILVGRLPMGWAPLPLFMSHTDGF